MGCFDKINITITGQAGNGRQVMAELELVCAKWDLCLKENQGDE